MNSLSVFPSFPQIQKVETPLFPSGPVRLGLWLQEDFRMDLPILHFWSFMWLRNVCSPRIVAHCGEGWAMWFIYLSSHTATHSIHSLCCSLLHLFTSLFISAFAGLSIHTYTDPLICVLTLSFHKQKENATAGLIRETHNKQRTTAQNDCTQGSPRRL